MIALASDRAKAMLLTLQTVEGGGFPRVRGQEGGGFFYDTGSSTPRHLSPSSQEVTVEFVSKYRARWPGSLQTAPVASRLHGTTSAAFLEAGLVPAWSCR